MQIISTSFRFWKNSRISLVWRSLKRWIFLSALILSGAFFNRQDIAARRSLFMPVNRSVLDVVQKRKDWNDLISGFKASDLVFLDESGCNTDMTMPILLAEAELSILHHFPSPRTQPFCHRFGWMGHYIIRLSQVEQLWRGLSSIWKPICCLIWTAILSSWWIIWSRTMQRQWKIC